MLIIDEWGDEHLVAQANDLFTDPRSGSDAFVGSHEEVEQHEIGKYWAQVSYYRWPNKPASKTNVPRKVHLTDMHSRSAMISLQQDLDAAFRRREQYFDLRPTLEVILELRAERFDPRSSQRLSFDASDC